MALLGEDLFSENILDEPNDLERVEEGDVYEEYYDDEENNPENEGTNNEKKEDADEDKKDVKKKRKASQKPKLNILKLMDKNGLTAIEHFFKDIKFKGKHHEREDLNLIMRKLEIWAHQLYPSLQFDDCLGKLEKLGSNKSVITYVKKIRMGLEDGLQRSDDLVVDSDENDTEIQSSATVNDPFDQLISNENAPPVPQTTCTPGLTAEQRERMLQNRLIAEQRRMARMKARMEQQKENDNKVTSAGSEITKDASSEA